VGQIGHVGVAAGKTIHAACTRRAKVSSSR
jgi:hypothetical protein